MWKTKCHPDCSHPFPPRHEKYITHNILISSMIASWTVLLLVLRVMAALAQTTCFNKEKKNASGLSNDITGYITGVASHFLLYGQEIHIWIFLFLVPGCVLVKKCKLSRTWTIRKNLFGFVYFSGFTIVLFDHWTVLEDFPPNLPFALYVQDFNC